MVYIFFWFTSELDQLSPMSAAHWIISFSSRNLSLSSSKMTNNLAISTSLYSCLLDTFCKRNGQDYPQATFASSSSKIWQSCRALYTYTLKVFEMFCSFTRKVTCKPKYSHPNVWWTQYFQNYQYILRQKRAEHVNNDSRFKTSEYSPCCQSRCREAGYCRCRHHRPRALACSEPWLSGTRGHSAGGWRWMVTTWTAGQSPQASPAACQSLCRNSPRHRARRSPCWKSRHRCDYSDIFFYWNLSLTPTVSHLSPGPERRYTVSPMALTRIPNPIPHNGLPHIVEDML